MLACTELRRKESLNPFALDIGKASLANTGTSAHRERIDSVSASRTSEGQHTGIQSCAMKSA